MFAVCVTFQIKTGAMDDFLPLMRENARLSLANEGGCHRFDVLTDPARSDEVFLYEVYTDPAAFDAHLASVHFQEFDKAVSQMIAEKDVRTYSEGAT